MLDTDLTQTMRQPNMSIDNMWETVKGGNDFGVEGYEVPRQYLDFKKQKKDREIEEQVIDQIKQPKKYWPIKKNDELVIFKRPNYLDDVNHIKKGFQMVQLFLRQRKSRKSLRENKFKKQNR
jgi:hypothetical protein